MRTCEGNAHTPLLASELARIIGWCSALTGKFSLFGKLYMKCVGIGRSFQIAEYYCKMRWVTFLHKHVCNTDYRYKKISNSILKLCCPTWNNAVEQCFINENQFQAYSRHWLTLTNLSFTKLVTVLLVRLNVTFFQVSKSKLNCWLQVVWPLTLPLSFLLNPSVKYPSMTNDLSVKTMNKLVGPHDITLK